MSVIRVKVPVVRVVRQDGSKELHVTKCACQFKFNYANDRGTGLYATCNVCGFFYWSSKTGPLVITLRTSVEAYSIAPEREAYEL